MGEAMIVSLNFFGEDFIADIDYRVTSYGSPAHMGSLSYPGDPGDPPEWEITSIWLYRDAPMTAAELQGKLITTPIFVATGALFDCLANLDKINDAISEEIGSDSPSAFDCPDF
jgi:hypothetical protein